MKRAVGYHNFPRKAKSPREILDASAAEKDFTRSVIEAFEWRQWRIFHTTDSRLDSIYGETGNGFPDLIAIRRDPTGRVRCVAAELKTVPGKVAPDQLVWLGLWQALSIMCANRYSEDADSPIEVYTWRPGDMDKIMSIAE